MRARTSLACLLLLAACRSGAGTGKITPAKPAQAPLLVGPRTLLIDTMAELYADGTGQQQHVLRLGGELAQAAGDALAEPDEGKRGRALAMLGALVLRVEDVRLLDARRTAPGEVTLRFVQTWDALSYEGDLRVIATVGGMDEALYRAVVPVTVEAQMALMGRNASPAPPERLPQSRVEQRYSLGLPDGFRARALPPPMKVEANGVVVERRLMARGAGRVDGLLRLEVAPAGVTSAGVDQLYQRLTPAERSPPPLQLEMTAEVLLASGKLADALKENRRLVAAHGEEAFYRAKHAVALLRLGLVETAQAEARRGVELAPKDPYANQILAYTLENNLFGQLYGPGYDREAAIAARRQQLALTGPAGRGAYDLAVLLSWDAMGRQLSPGTPLEEIVDLLAGTGSYPVESAELRVRALFALGRGADAERVVRESLNDEAHRPQLLAAITLARGIDATVAELPSLSLSEEAAAMPMMRAAFLLLHVRSYPAAAALANAAGRANPRWRQQADEIGRLAKIGERKPDARPAVEAFRRLVESCARPESFERAAATLLDPRARERVPPPAAPAVPLYDRTCRGLLLHTGWPASAWMIESELTADFDVSGDPQTGYRVRHRPPPAQSIPGLRTFFFTVQGGTPRMLGPGPFVAADEAFRLAQAGKLAPAVTWLGWARELLVDRGPGGRPGPFARTFDTLWADQPAELAPVRDTASAVLASSALRARMVLPTLERALAASKDVNRRKVLALALLEAQLSAERGRDADRTGDLLEKLGVADPASAGARARAALAAGNCAKAVSIVRELWRREPSSDAANRFTSMAVACDQRAEAIDVLRKAITLEDPAPSLFNNLAWYLAFEDKPGAEALTMARQAAERSGRRSPSLLHTLAMVAGRAGELAESRGALKDALDRAPPGSLPLDEGARWLVTGITAEAVGLPEEATKAYRRVTKEGRPEMASTSNWTLAQRRLQALAGQQAGR